MEDILKPWEENLGKLSRNIHPKRRQKIVGRGKDISLCLSFMHARKHGQDYSGQRDEGIQIKT